MYVRAGVHFTNIQYIKSGCGMFASDQSNTKARGASRAEVNSLPGEKTKTNSRPASDSITTRLLKPFIPSRFPVALKLAFSIGVLITVGMSLLGAVIIHNQIDLLNKQVYSNGRTVVLQMAESAKEPILANDSLVLDVLTYSLATADNVLGTTIYSADRKMLSSTGYNPFDMRAPYANRSRQYLNNSLNTLEWQWENSPTGRLEAVSFISPVLFEGVVVGYVLTSFSRDAMSQSINDAVRSIVSTTVILIMLGIIMSYFLGWRLSQPLHSLLKASRAIGMGRYNYRIQESRNDEIGDLINSVNSTARMLELKSNRMAVGILQRKQVEEAFSRYVSPNIANEIMGKLSEVKVGGDISANMARDLMSQQRDGMDVGGKNVNASVVFIDIVGFTSKSEAMSPTGVARLLNEFYSNITRTVSLYKGTIDKYIGDCAMVLFGIPQEDKDHVFHSIAYAVFFRRLMDEMNKVRIKSGDFPVFFRVGINSGEMLAGNMGTNERMQYTVVGDTVNLSSRLCSAAETDQIIITEEVYSIPGIRDKVIATEYKSIKVKGKAEPIMTYLVHDVQGFYKAAMDRQLDALLQ